MRTDMKKIMLLKMPEQIKFVLKQIEKSGFKCSVVGGCIRDVLLGKTPKDWDICSNALPEQIKEIFEDYNTILTGEKYGTVTVVIEGEQIEITTFRIDGEYSDSRSPDEVVFTNDLTEDLSRRDFTINSMAWNEKDGLIDPFNGQCDLDKGLIRCVGNPRDRFQEDALRMLRAIRFSARFGFEIEKETFSAISWKSHLINYISSERIISELNQIITTEPKLILTMCDLGLMDYIIPEFKNCLDCKQNNPYHKYRVGFHMIKSMECIERNIPLRLTMMLHDIAKPICKTTDENGVDHFYGHNVKGSDMAVDILRRLRYSNDVIEEVKTLILYHDSEIQVSSKAVRRWLNKIGEDLFLKLLLVREADISAQNKEYHVDRLIKIIDIRLILQEVLSEKQCFSKKDLAINGKDLIQVGYPQGIILGKIIDCLVDQVIENPENNTKEKLLDIAKGFNDRII